MTESQSEALCNHDEMLFQIVHQVEELWMKLAAFTLLEIDDWMAKRQACRVITLFERVNRIMRLMTSQLDLLETMSPKEYQEIRFQLGNGSTDVGELDNVGLRCLGQRTQLGQGVVGSLVLRQHLSHGSQDAAAQGDVTRFHRHACF